MSQQNLDLLKKHYEEVNRSTLELQENFRSKNISIISYLFVYFNDWDNYQKILFAINHNSSKKTIITKNH